MRAGHILAMLASLAALSGCAPRWQPESEGRVTLPEACPQRRAPAVEDFGESGVRGVYHFVTEGASREEVGALLRRTSAQQFALMPLTVNINGRDTLFGQGPAILRDQGEVDAEFSAACRLGAGRVYLTHVRYDPAGENGPVRAR